MNDRIPLMLAGRRYEVLRHAFVQAVILLISAVMLWEEPDRILPDRFVPWLLYALQLDIVVYGNMLLLVPRLLFKNRLVLYFLSLTGLIVASAFVISLFQPSTDNPALNNAQHMPPLLGVLSQFIAFYLFIIGLTAMQLLRYRLRNMRRIEALRAATANVEMENLRNQINPHFLFNMLNNANIMTDEDAEKSSFILSKLNDLLHYQIEEGSKKTIRLADDIAFLEDYLSLEKLRRDRFDFTIGAEGRVDVDLPPLLFIPFVENAVKHNPENDSWVNLSFRVAGGRLWFECRNPKAVRPVAKKQGGIGLVNIRRRLDLLFGDDYSLDLQDADGFYTVKMEIKI